MDINSNEEEYFYSFRFPLETTTTKIICCSEKEEEEKIQNNRYAFV